MQSRSYMKVFTAIDISAITPAVKRGLNPDYTKPVTVHVYRYWSVGVSRLVCVRMDWPVALVGGVMEYRLR